MIVFDTPGLMEPKYALQESMRSTSLVALADAMSSLHRRRHPGEVKPSSKQQDSNRPRARRCCSFSTRSIFSRAIG
jgi:hypothetical protein